MPTPKMSYRWCFVPGCDNTTKKSPEKLFFCVPLEEKQKKKWFRVARREYTPIKTQLFCCEDHFTLKDDMENYIQYSSTGTAKKLKKDVLPHIFNCQNNRIVTENSRPTSIRRTRQALVAEILQESVATNTKPSNSKKIIENETPNGTAKTVKGQWKALKDTYRKEAKKVINDPNYHSSWAKLEPMSFIHDQLGLENNVDPLSDQNSSQSFVQQENKIEFVYENVPDTANNGENFATSSRGVKRKVEASEECSTNEEVEDEDWYFFKSLMPHIKQLSPQRKMLMRMKIMETVYKEVYSYDLQE